MSDWISVEDAQPPEMKTVIITDGSCVGIGYCSKDGDEHYWNADGYDSWMFRSHAITHWQLLPEPPK